MKVCREADCQTMMIAKGLCRRHYNARRHFLKTRKKWRTNPEQKAEHRKLVTTASPYVIEQAMLDGEIGYDEFLERLEAAGWDQDFKSGDFVLASNTKVRASARVRQPAADWFAPPN